MMLAVCDTIPRFPSLLIEYAHDKEKLSMLKKFLPAKHRLLLVLSALLVLVLVPAIILVHPGRAAHASGGGGGGGGSPIANIFPTQGGPGTVINVNGFNYPSNVTVTVFFQTKLNGTVTAVTDQGGFFSTFVTAPESYTAGVHYFVHVNSATLNVQALFTFTKPSITVFSEVGFQQRPVFGTQAAVNGSGFAANETVDLTWDLGTLGTIKAGIAATDSSGFFFSNFVMPSLPFGVLTHLTAHGRISGLSASFLVNESPAIYASPTQGVIGAPVSLNGGGFGSNENVKVLFQGVLVATAHTNIKGAFSSNFAVPTSAKIGFQNNGIVAFGKTSGVAANTFFNVEPNVSISPNTGFDGTVITVRGSNFTPNGFVEILWVFPNGGGSGGSGGNTQFIGQSSVNSHGTFSTTVTAPFSLISGQKYFVLVIDGPSNGSNQAVFKAV
jgi:hypothetical protein